MNKEQMIGKTNDDLRCSRLSDDNWFKIVDHSNQCNMAIVEFIDSEENNHAALMHWDCFTEKQYSIFNK